MMYGVFCKLCCIEHPNFWNLLEREKKNIIFLSYIPFTFLNYFNFHVLNFLNIKIYQGFLLFFHLVKFF